MKVIQQRIVLAAVCVSIFLLISHLWILSTPRGANQDFIQYWTSWRLLHGGLNAYDPQTLYDLQVLQGLTEKTARMFWCPPWALFLLQPILLLSFSNAQFVWMHLSFLIWGLCCLYLFFRQRDLETGHLWPTFLISLSMPQVWDNAHAGQISIILVPMFLAALHFLKVEKKFTAGLLFSAFSIKPHLFYLIWIYLLWKMLREKDFKLMLGLVSGIIILVSLSEIYLPHAVDFWLNTFRFNEDSPLVIPRASWMVPTLPLILRVYVFPSAIWLSFMVPLVVAVLTLSYFIFSPKHPADDLAVIMLTPLSLFTAPYGWFYDQVLLLPFFWVVLSMLLHYKRGLYRSLILILFVTTWIVSIVQYDFFAKWQHEFWWVSLNYAVLGVLLFNHLVGGSMIEEGDADECHTMRQLGR